MQSLSGYQGPGPAGKKSNSILAVVVGICLSALPIQQSASAQEPILLNPGETIEFDLEAGETFALDLQLSPGETYLVDVAQGGFDLQVDLTVPGGETTRFNSPLFREETELLVIEKSEAGPYRLEISTTEHSGAVSHPSVSLQRLDGPYAAEKLVSDSSAAHASEDQGGWRKALDLLEQCEPAAGAVEDSRLLARCLNSMASLHYWWTSDWDRGIEMAGRAADIYRASGADGLAAGATTLQGAIVLEKTWEIEKTPGEGLPPEAARLYDEGLELFRKARDIQSRLGNRYEVANNTNYIGLLHFYMGDYDTAAENYREAIAEFRALEEWYAEYIPLNNLAMIDFDQGHLVRAEESFNRLLQVLPAESTGARASTYDNLAASQLALGQLDEALRSYSRALELHEKTGSTTGRGRSLSGLGFTYQAIGETDLALDYLQNALTLRRQAKDGRGILSTLNTLGRIYRVHGEYEKALEAHREAERLAATQIDKARTELEIARDLVVVGKPADALQTLSGPVATARSTDNLKLTADIAVISADANCDEGQADLAVNNYGDASRIYHELQMSAEHADTLYRHARCLRRLDRLSAAGETVRQAIGIAENLRGQLIAPELRAFFLSRRQNYYTFLIDVLLDRRQQAGSDEQGHLSEALAVSERRRARSLVDLIHEASIERHEEGGERDRLATEMAEARYRLNRLLEEPVSPEQQTGLVRTRQELAEIENRLHMLDIEYRASHPGFAQLTDPTILNPAQMQGMLGNDTALLQYTLGDESSFVFLVTSGEVRAWPLAKRSSIEAAATSLHGSLGKPILNKADGERFAGELAAWSAMILPPDVPLPGSRLVVVPDGVLQYLPFPVLTQQAGEAAGQTLLSTHEVLQLPSLSVLAAQRHRNMAERAPTADIALFADPVFMPEDPRFIKAGDDPASSFDATRIATPGSPPELQRLPATAFEARTIAGLVDPERLLLATGFEASRNNVLNAQLSDYRVVHFATHGLVDSRYPALSALVFSQLDEQGNRLNGMLRLHDIYGLDLNSDLVTLSACRTALGRNISGEGLTGLTQGLMYSGSRAVLASLWQVPDRATAELMKRFYTNLFELGQTPSKALRNAQLDLSSQARWRHPYFWSAFVLQGDWE